MSETSFVQVGIKKAAGFNLLNKEEFLAIPMDERMTLISSGQIQFLIDGVSIPLREGLKKLKEQA